MDKNETHCDETYDWLQDRRHQTVLKTMHTIAYEFNPETGEEINKIGRKERGTEEWEKDLFYGEL